MYIHLRIYTIITHLFIYNLFAVKINEEDRKGNE